MTCDERIEKTLNTAGQTISDLPKPSESSFAYSGKLEEAYSAAMKFSEDEEAEEYGYLYLGLVLSDYILHLTDIIDRMETALENVCGERDYLRSVVCGLCSDFRMDGADACETCIVGDGVPEYWRADDEKGL